MGKNEYRILCGEGTAPGDKRSWHTIFADNEQAAADEIRRLYPHLIILIIAIACHNWH